MRVLSHLPEVLGSGSDLGRRAARRDADAVSGPPPVAKLAPAAGQADWHRRLRIRLMHGAQLAKAVSGARQALPAGFRAQGSAGFSYTSASRRAGL